MLERLHLLVGDDPANVLVQPLLVDALQLLPERLLLGELFLVARLTFQRVGLLLRRRSLCHSIWRVLVLRSRHPAAEQRKREKGRTADKVPQGRHNAGNTPDTNLYFSAGYGSV